MHTQVLTTVQNNMPHKYSPDQLGTHKETLNFKPSTSYSPNASIGRNYAIGPISIVFALPVGRDRSALAGGNATLRISTGGP